MVGIKNVCLVNRAMSILSILLTMVVLGMFIYVHSKIYILSNAQNETLIILKKYTIVHDTQANNIDKLTKELHTQN